ncbi:MAG: FkbM family methyltransferase [Bacteroidota bacterium]
MKQLILGTALGRIGIITRDKFQLLRDVFSVTESIGTTSNDQLASLLVTRLCESGHTFIDVGAHIGSIISEVRHNDITIKIIAVEAMPDKALKLRQKFPDVEIHEYAAGESEGEISFYINTIKSGYSSLGKPAEEHKSNIREITVSLARLDNLVSSNDIDVIKIDVEGAELGVLRGCVNIINNNRPVIMFESAPPQNDGLGYSKEEMWEFFTAHDYEIVVPNRVAHNGQGLSKEGFIESHVYPRRTTNYFAIPAERRVEIRNRARNILNISV